MSEVILKPVKTPVSGEIHVPGDKSISHRSVMLASLAEGETTVTNFLDGEDCMRTVQAFQEMGVEIKKQNTTLTIQGNGIAGLKEPENPLYFGNSGTTARLMIGLLAGLPLFTTIYGDSSLSKRPMDRVIKPLRQMGAVIDGREKGSYIPLSLRGSKLQGIDYVMPLKSAQVKSAVLLAGLHAEGATKITERTKTRDHTENMLKAFGASIKTEGKQVTITNEKTLVATDVHVPGDISSAAFFIAAALIVPGSKLTLKNVGLNRTRTGIIDVLISMGANIQIRNKQTISGELLGDIIVSYSKLTGTTIGGEIIPRLIDEIPILALIATQAEGTTIIKDAKELRVKETDRIAAVDDVLSTLGATIEPTEDGMKIHGEAKLHGGKATSYHDHRIAMMAAIASLIAEDEVVIDDISSISISYPSFFEDLKKIK
ncbi:3-phosphoshikimate 1-carboxyvinyltransferase [Virgibacillus halodenitrificans]|uniref:3-phosphoshikimate 1-carboxyvinyltransferase n=1 Tax=Virgibacillus halodenitrificans TaxID=1482 RepID=UPI002DBBDBBB|nr:3-phosphoshikimate 1-carboxyvinyltransferase [Virgibacillus halodenitrificans]MEC2160399.1 3-phosphoshikimate 1-carboxyvinyltransferase [Virgibacillus halodenitrificans]